MDSFSTFEKSNLTGLASAIKAEAIVLKPVGTVAQALQGLAIGVMVCSFVNGFRIDELKRVYAENPQYTNESLAQSCGFGSVNSMKRTIEAKTGMSISDFKMSITGTDKSI